VKTQREAKRAARREWRAEKRKRDDPWYRLGAWWAHQTHALGVPRPVSFFLGAVLYAPVFVLHTIAWAVGKTIGAALALAQRLAKRS
jgi:hypothetical protein